MSRLLSYENHNRQYIQDSAFDREKIAHDLKNEDNYKFLYQDDVPHGDVLDQTDFKYCVDIGAGTGWFANYLVEKRGYKKVYAIEPSEAALKIAGELYPEQTDVDLIVGFAEEEVPKLKLRSKALFSTMCVFAHLTDDVVEEILKTIDGVSKKGSTLVCSEPWGETYHRECWHVRTPEWWSDNMPDWEFEFYSDYTLSDPPGRHKGFTATKL